MIPPMLAHEHHTTPTPQTFSALPSDATVQHPPEAGVAHAGGRAARVPRAAATPADGTERPAAGLLAEGGGVGGSGAGTGWVAG